MTTSAVRDAVRAAEKKIARVLCELEQQTGDLVESLDLARFDATCLDDDGPRHLVCVRIDLVRRPGHEWDAA